MPIRNRRGRRVAAWCAGLLTTVLLSGCATSWTYVTNSADRTYLKVPTTWHEVDTSALGAKLNIRTSKGSPIWFTAYDADATPSVDHVFGAGTNAPVVFVFVRDIPESDRGQFSLDTLRDVLNPVSPIARQQAAMLGGGASPITPISDTVLTPGHGLHGVHIVYGKDSPAGGTPQIYDQIGYLNDDASMLYLFVAQCSLDCYQQRQREIANVVSSFTVKESP
jgi:hypothetical protein